MATHWIWIGAAALLLGACTGQPQGDEPPMDASEYVVTTVRGEVDDVDGQKTIVEVVVAVDPQGDPEAAAIDKLLEMVPSAVPMKDWRYATTGLYWDSHSADTYYNASDEPDSAAGYSTE